MLELTTSVQYAKGIGPRLADILAAKGIHTIDDLLHYLPFRYEDRLNPRTIPELRAGEMATVIAEVRNSGLFRTRRMPIFQMTAGQGRSRPSVSGSMPVTFAINSSPGKSSRSTARSRRTRAAASCRSSSPSLKS